MPVDFVFMLTRNDRTVENCHELAQMALDAGVRHVGFKDIGADHATLGRLAARLHDGGARVYLEVVTESPDAAAQAARLGASIGVDALLGGLDADEMLRAVDGTGIDVLPFPGTPTGHPTRLAGSADDIRRDTERFMSAGCAGVDVLAWRATDADPVDLIRGARSACSGTVLVAGSIDSPEQIHALSEAGADAFTIGSAIIDERFAPDASSLRDRLAIVLETAAQSRSVDDQV